MDIEIVNLELILADLQQLEGKIERLESQVKGDRKTYGPILELAEKLKEYLESGRPIATYPDLSALQQRKQPVLHLEGLSGCIFRTNHASNYLALWGTLPADKGRLLRLLDDMLAAPDGPRLKPEYLRGL